MLFKYLEKCKVQTWLNYCLIIGIFLLFIFLASGPTYAFEVKGGEINLLRSNSTYFDLNYTTPEYLSTEDLIFYTCTEENQTVVSSVLCLDDTSFEDIDLMRWKVNSDTCYIGSYDLSKKTCKSIEIQSYYKKGDETITLTKPIRVNRFSSLLDVVIDKQYSDGGWRTAIDTAAGIWILSNYKQIFSEEIESGLDWLKKNRDNDMKCWPVNDCSMETTANILAFLTLSKVDDKRRIIHDGTEYLHYMQNFYMPDDIWKLTVTPIGVGRNQNLSCIISYNRSNLLQTPFLLQYNTVAEYNLKVFPNERFYVICDGNFYANLTTQDNENVFTYEGDNLTYVLPYACWSKDNKWGKCDILTTEFAMMANISEDSFEQGFYYLNSELYNERTNQKYVGIKKNITESSLYLYLNKAELENINSLVRSTDLDEDQDNKKSVLAYVRFKQNNNGSWGISNATMEEKVRATGYSVISLMSSNFSRNHEVIEDAESWLSDLEVQIAGNKTREYTGFNKTEVDALAFVGLKNNIRPFLKSTPKILVVDKNDAVIELYNPTTFDLDELTYSFEGDIKGVLDIEERESMEAYSYIRLNVKRAVLVNDTLNGYLDIYNYDDNIARIPVMVVNYPKFSLESKTNSLTIFGTSSRIELDIDKSEHIFECNIVWDHDDITSKNKVSFSKNGQNFLDISFKEAERVERVYFADFTCIPTLGVKDEFKKRIRVDVSRYPKFPFEISPNNLVFVNQSGESSYVIVKNNLDESIDVSLKFEQDNPHFKLSRDSFILDPSAEANITIFNNAPNQNITVNDIISVKALGVEKKVQFRAMIIQETKVTFKYAAIIGLVGLIVALGVGAFFVWKNRDQLSFDTLFKGGKGSKKVDKTDMLKVRMKTYEEKERRTAIVNMMKIMRMLNKPETEIRTRLTEEGFTGEQIDDAIAFDAEQNQKLAEKKKAGKKEEKK